LTVFKRDVYDASDRTTHFTRTQDVEPILENNKHLREKTARGDFKHKWDLPVVMVNKFYDQYCGGNMRPMNEEFWRYVDRLLMDPDYAAFRTNNTSNFRVGYK
jgi:hypothetical protein